MSCPTDADKETRKRPLLVEGCKKTPAKRIKRDKGIVTLQVVWRTPYSADTFIRQNNTTVEEIDPNGSRWTEINEPDIMVLKGDLSRKTSLLASRDSIAAMRAYLKETAPTSLFWPKSINVKEFDFTLWLSMMTPNMLIPTLLVNSGVPCGTGVFELCGLSSCFQRLFALIKTDTDFIQYNGDLHLEIKLPPKEYKEYCNTLSHWCNGGLGRSNPFSFSVLGLHIQHVTAYSIAEQSIIGLKINLATHKVVAIPFGESGAAPVIVIGTPHKTMQRDKCRIDIPESHANDLIRCALLTTWISSFELVRASEKTNMTEAMIGAISQIVYSEPPTKPLGQELDILTVFEYLDVIRTKKMFRVPARVLIGGSMFWKPHPQYVNIKHRESEQTRSVDIGSAKMTSDNWRSLITVMRANLPKFTG